MAPHCLSLSIVRMRKGTLSLRSISIVISRTSDREGLPLYRLGVFKGGRYMVFFFLLQNYCTE